MKEVNYRIYKCKEMKGEEGDQQGVEVCEFSYKFICMAAYRHPEACFFNGCDVSVEQSSNADKNEIQEVTEFV